MLSARDAGALSELAVGVRELVGGQPGVGAADVGYALATTRSVGFADRLVVVGSGREELLAGLGEADTSPLVVRGRAGDGRVAVLFCGHG